MDFTTALKEREITIDSVPYKIVEFDGTMRAEYLNTMQKRTTIQGGKVVGLSTHAGFYSALISRCLVDATGTRVNEKVIDKWPASMQKQMFEL